MNKVIYFNMIIIKANLIHQFRFIINTKINQFQTLEILIKY